MLFLSVISHVPSIFQELEGEQCRALPAGMADWRGVPYLGGAARHVTPTPPR